MKIDLHLHSEHSPDSRFALLELKGLAEAYDLSVIAITDHENIDGCREFMRLATKVALLPGIEVTAREGDFLIYAPHPELLQPLHVRGLRSIEDFKPRGDMAVVWAHPLSRRFGDDSKPYAEGQGLKTVMSIIDGVEILNGKMLNLVALKEEPEEYPRRIKDLAATFGKAPTGGSDSHNFFTFMNCWTEIPPAYSSPEGVIEALKRGLTAADYDADYYRRVTQTVFAKKKL